MSRSHSSRSVEDRLWSTVGRANDLSSSTAVGVALSEVRARLAATSPEEVSLFDQWLNQRLFDLDRQAFYNAPVHLRDGKIGRQSEDHFLYARCACVLAGRENFEGILEGGLSFSRFADTRLQSAENLLYLAEEVCEETFGMPLERLASPPLEAGSNHEFWNAE